MQQKKANHTIMIVDDSITNLQAAAILLGELESLEIIQVTNGSDALRTASERCEDIDLILLDIVMPGLSGFEVCGKLKSEESTARIPVIFMTALDNEENEEQGLTLGAIDYIKKPFSPAITRARIRNYLELKSYQDALRDASLMDSLTEMPNRRSFDVVYDRELARARRFSGSLACLMVDIDYFKVYNDHYGHVRGDSCIASVARAIKSSFQREIDFCARYGGEEFVVLIPEGDSRAAGIAAEKIMQSVRDLALEHRFSLTADIVTVSVGYASLEGPQMEKRCTLIEMADRALYRAKKNGRNRAEAEFLD